MSYEAFWIPESSASTDLAIGDRWLRQANYPGERVIVLNTAKIAMDVPALGNILNHYPVFSPRGKDRPKGRGNAVLAPWCVGDALELAEELASDGGGLLVIDSEPRSDDVSEWLRRTGARALPA